MRADGTYTSWLVQENNRFDEMTVDQLLDEGLGVCRHMAICATGIYEQLKARDKTGRLKNTVLAYTTSRPLDAHDMEDHAYCVLLAHRDGYGTMVSVTDPTFYIGSHTPHTKELHFTRDRFTAAADIVLGPKFLEKTKTPKEEVIAAVNYEIDRLFGSVYQGADTINRILALSRYVEMLGPKLSFRERAEDLALVSQKILNFSKQRGIIPIIALERILMSNQFYGGESFVAIKEIAQALSQVPEADTVFEQRAKLASRLRDFTYMFTHAWREVNEGETPDPRAPFLGGTKIVTDSDYRQLRTVLKKIEENWHVKILSS